MDGASNVVTWLFLDMISVVQLLNGNVQSIKLKFGRNEYGKKQYTIYRTENVFRKSHANKLIKSLTKLICEKFCPCNE